MAGSSIMIFWMDWSREWTKLVTTPFETQFQSYVQLTRLQIVTKPLAPGKRTKVIERSVQNNRYCFLELTKQEGALTGLAINSIFCFLLWKKSLICPSPTPRQGNTFLFCSYKQLSLLWLGPFKGFLSRHGALQGPSPRALLLDPQRNKDTVASGVERYAQRSQNTV